MSSILDIVMEILALEKLIKEEVQKPVKKEMLSLIYEIKPRQEEISLEEFLKKYNANNLLEVVQKFTSSMRSDKNAKNTK